jgi:SSS family solute:Na+ symporter/sodium/pantothenate symporter
MPDFAGGILVATGIYVVLLVAIGWASRRARREHTLSDFYLAGRSIGLTVLLLTLFATQYSGNSLSGFPGQTYREGLAYYMSVTFMVAIVTGYLLFAPRLFTLSRRHAFVTPGDFLRHCYTSPIIHHLGSAIFVFTLVNFLLAQLIAMGHAFAGLTDGRIPYWLGVVGGAAVILVYELMGGMRAVAWTDALQGVVLMVGLLVAAVLLVDLVGSPASVLERVAVVAPEKLAAPSYQTCALWMSNFLLLGLGAPLYPQAIQRIYAARRLDELRRALATMAFLPHFAITTVVFIGLAGIALFPGLGRLDSDQVTFRVLAHLVEERTWTYVPVLLVMMAVLAAIMSTADSCLLSLSSILTKDVVRAGRSGDAENLSRLGVLTSVGALAVVVPLALRPPTTLWGLLVIKFELLIQLSPAFVLGTWGATRDDAPADGLRFGDREILLGILVGLTVALGLYGAGLPSLGGLHAGTIGVLANYATAVASALSGPRAPRRTAASA